MSSEGSDSRLRQFGLYKTIDSQTAEFLKLSRKRQMRRGCACAVVSTLITVTVVVVSLLIYEYGLKTELNFKMRPNTLRKFKWFNRSNEFKSTFGRMKTKNNGTLIAVMLKALDQKGKLEAAVEERTSEVTSTEVPVYSLLGKVLADDKMRRWPGRKPVGYRFPQKITTKLNTLVLENYNFTIDHFGEARKIEDYWKVMEFLNKMSSTNNPEETSDAHVSSTWDPFFLQYYRSGALNKNKASKLEAFVATNVKEMPVIDSGGRVYCACPNRSKLTDLLEELYHTIHQLNLKGIVSKATSNPVNDKVTSSPTVTNPPAVHYSSETNFLTINMDPTIYMDPTTTTSAPIIPTLTDPRSKTRVSSIPSGSIAADYQPIFFQNERDQTTNIYVEVYDDPALRATYERPTGNKHINTVLFGNVKSHRQPSNRKKVTAATTTESIKYSTPHISPGKEIKPLEYNEITNYIDGLSKFFTNTLIVHKPLTPAPMDITTKKRGFRPFFSYEIADAGTHLTNRTENKKVSKPYALPGPAYPTKLIKKSKNNAHLRNDRILFQSLIEGKPEITRLKTPEKRPVNNFGAHTTTVPKLETTTELSELTTELTDLTDLTTELTDLTTELSESQDLPFNVKFDSNDYEGDVRTIQAPYTRQPTITWQSDDIRLDEYGPQKHTKKQQPKPLVVKHRQTTHIAPPAKPSIEEVTGEKKSKIKEIFYMTGETSPVDDFEENLSSLMHYEPYNYAEFANAFLNRRDSASVEKTMSMVPTHRSSHLEVGRKHGPDFSTTLLYNNDEQEI